MKNEPHTSCKIKAVVYNLNVRICFFFYLFIYIRSVWFILSLSSSNKCKRDIFYIQ